MNGWPSPARPCARVFPNGILCRLFTPQKSFRWDYKPSSRVYTHAQRSHTHVNDHASPCKSSVDYGNTKTPSLHCKLDSTSLLQLTISGKSDPNFAWRKSQWDKTVVEKKKKVISAVHLAAFFPIIFKLEVCVKNAQTGFYLWGE